LQEESVGKSNVKDIFIVESSSTVAVVSTLDIAPLVIEAIVFV
jgi:hypothetical protein